MTARMRHADAWRILTWVAVGAFAAFRLAELTRYALWYDEIFSLSVAQRDWHDLLSAAVADRTNPPLFYLLLKVWIDIGGESVAWMRLLPCAAGIAVAVPFVALARRAFESSDMSFEAAPTRAEISQGDASGVAVQAFPHAMLATGVAVAAGAASPLLVALSNELRAYSFLLLFTTLSLLAFSRMARASTVARTAALAHAEMPAFAATPAHAETPQSSSDLRRSIILLVVVNIALVYTHYFGWLVVAAEVGVALFWNRCAIKPALLAALVTAVAFAPWAAAVMSSAEGAVRPLSNVDWITRPTLGAIPVFYDALVARVITPSLAFLGAVIVVAPLGVLAIAAARHNIDPRTRRCATALLWFAAFPVLAVFLASVLGERSAFVPRYLVVAAPAWWLLLGMAAVGLGTPAWTWPKTFLTAATFSAFTLAAGVMREVRGREKIPWDAVVAAIGRDAGPAGGTVYSLEGFTALPLTYYAAASGVPLSVRPLRELAGIQPPAWLVVRSTPGGSAGALGGGLRPRGATLKLVTSAAILSQRIDVYRVEPEGPAVRR